MKCCGSRWIKKALKTTKNVLIGTSYRRPGSDPNLFNKKLNEVLTKIDYEKNKNTEVRGPPLGLGHRLFIGTKHEKINVEKV